MRERMGSSLSRRAWLGGAAALSAWCTTPWLQAQPPAPAATRPPLLQVFGRAGGSGGAAQRVFAAGPPAAVLLACLAPERLLGWPMALRDSAKALLPPVLRDKPVLGRLAGRGSTVSLEALLALQPDLIVDAGNVDATYVSTAQRVAEQTGLPYALLDGRLADSPAQLRALGRLLGVQARADTLASLADEALAAAATVQGGAAGVPGVYLARGADGLETATAGSINAEFIEAAGGRNVAATGRAGVARVSMEQVLGWSPDWVLTQDRNFHRLAQTEATWRTLPAVREGRLLLAPDLPFGWLDGPPAINRLLGVQWLAVQLKQRQRLGGRALDDLLAQAQRFYTLFYGSTPAREQLQGWLDGRD